MNLPTVTETKDSGSDLRISSSSDFFIVTRVQLVDNRRFRFGYSVQFESLSRRRRRLSSAYSPLYDKTTSLVGFQSNGVVYVCLKRLRTNVEVRTELFESRIQQVYNHSLAFKLNDDVFKDLNMLACT